MSELKDNLDAILAEKQSKIIPENIIAGVSIFDVDGSAVELNGQTRTVSPTTSQQIIEPDQDHNALTQVTINAVDNTIDQNIISGNIKSGVTILGISGKSSVVDTDDANALATDLAINKSAYVNGTKITGTVYDITNGPSEENILSTDVTENKGSISLNGNFVSVVFDNVMNWGGASCRMIIDMDTTQHLGIKNTVLSPAIGLTASKLKAGESVIGVTGTFTSDANAIASDIAAGKTAYVNGQKITGTGAMTFATEAEMNLVDNVPENTLAIVYGTSYGGTFRFDHGSWTKIGSASDEQLMMDNLNAVMNTSDEYEGIGGTEQQLNEMFDTILGNNE